MVGDLFKFIFDESKKGGFKGVITVIKKIASVFVCLSPVLIYILLYHPIILKNDHVIITALIIGGSCLLYFIIFFASEIFATILLTQKLRKMKDLKNEEKEHYFYDNCSFITTVVQGTLSFSIIINYYCKHPSYIIMKQLNEIVIILAIGLGYIVLCAILWIYHLMKYIKYKKQLSNK